MKLLISRHDKIGDFLVTLPLVKAIKEQYPKTEITVLVSKINFNFAQNIAFIDEVILYDKENFLSTLKDIRAQNFDVSISGYIDVRLGWLLFLGGIKKRIAPATKIAQVLFNQTIAQRRSRVEKTEWQYNMDLGKVLFPQLKLGFSKPLLILPLKTPSSLFTTSFKKVVFHPGFGGSSDGNLILDDYLKLARSISGLNCEIIFTFGPDDGASKEYISQHLDFKALIIDSKMELIDFCGFLSQCEVFVSTSTGPMHLAGAMNIKTLSFFGENLFASSKRWATISESAKQNNFELRENYSLEEYEKIEKRLKEVL